MGYAAPEGLRLGGLRDFWRRMTSRPSPLCGARRWRRSCGLERLSAHEHPEAVADALAAVPRSRPFERIEELARIAAPAVGTPPVTRPIPGGGRTLRKDDPPARGCWWRNRVAGRWRGRGGGSPARCWSWPPEAVDLVGSHHSDILPALVRDNVHSLCQRSFWDGETLSQPISGPMQALGQAVLDRLELAGMRRYSTRAVAEGASPKTWSAHLGVGTQSAWMLSEWMGRRRA